MDPTFRPSSSLTPNTTVVPSCFDAAPNGVAGPRGVGMYRTKFNQLSNMSARLHFGACSFYCRIYIDGDFVADHRAGGYVAFTIDVPPPSTKNQSHAEVSRDLFVLADNRFNSTTAPMHTGGDFWHFGGLMRSVTLHELPPRVPSIWRAEILPNNVADISSRHPETGEYTVNVTIVLSDPTYNGPFTYTLRFGKKKSKMLGPFTGNAKNGRLETHSFVPVTGAVDESALWPLWTSSGVNPQDNGGRVKEAILHTLHVGDATGGKRAIVTERFALRTWGVDSRTFRITLNGKIIKLHGWNHHTQWPDQSDGVSVTASMSESQMDFDIAQMIDAGCNYVRGAHYPQDARWLDRLDEAGIAVWSETIGPGVSTHNIQDPTFMKLQLQQLDEMIDDAINHGSILTWGWFNEGPSDDEAACSGYRACSERATMRDPTRFVTWADDKEMNSKCLEYASLISFNNYPGWYNNLGNLSAPQAHWNEMARSVAEMYPGKPFAISETGAGAVFEWSNNATDAKWTTKYQGEIVGRDVDVALSNSRVSALTLWHYFDFKINDEDIATCGPCEYMEHKTPPTCSYINVSCTRPGGENHKGVVDFWRRKKSTWDIVKSKYTNHLFV